MQIFENVLLAVSGLKSNKMRALLTMLGIIIGIGSVIGIVMVGDSLTSSVTSSMQGLGATNIMVMLQGRSEEDGVSANTTQGVSLVEEDLITDEMIEKFSEVYADKVEAISTSQSIGSGKAQESRKYANVSISAVNEGYIKANNVELIDGRGIKGADIKGKRNVAVVSDKFINKMFKPNEKYIGEEVKLSFNNQFQDFIIVGVYKNVESGMFFAATLSSEDDISTNFYIPISTGQVLASADKGYQMITVMANSDTDTKEFSDEIKDFFNIFYENNHKFEIGVMSMESALESMTTMLGTISTAIAVIAAISLVVGGIGVMNIMLVSVTERTREIGTRKALGAKNSYIMMQFIVEAIIICIIGGIIGIILGMTIGFAGSSLLGFPAKVSINIIIISVLFSMGIGVFFGYYPANKASKLDPIEALRYE